MIKFFKRLIQLGRETYVPNEEQFVTIKYYKCEAPLTATISNGKYFGGNRSIRSNRKRK